MAGNEQEKTGTQITGIIAFFFTIQVLSFGDKTKQTYCFFFL